jgi:hypothetical protein
VFENGTNVHYIHTHDAARNSLEIQIHGERGAIVTTVSDHVQRTSARAVRSTPLQPSRSNKRMANRICLRDFHRYIIDRVEPGTSVRNNLETMAACEMMVRSIAQKAHRASRGANK